MNGADELLTIERVAVLQRVEMFRSVPGHTLAGVARLLDEVRIDVGVTFIERGAIECRRREEHTRQVSRPLRRVRQRREAGIGITLDEELADRARFPDRLAFVFDRGPDVSALRETVPLPPDPRRSEHLSGGGLAQHDRLAAVPATRWCLDCAEAEERGRRIPAGGRLIDVGAHFSKEQR